MVHLQATVLQLIHHYGYAGVFVVMVLGNLAVPVGTELVVPAAGAFAGAGHLNWPLVGAVATLGEVVGGLILYAIGWYAGAPVARRFGRRGQHELERIHGFYERYGARTVFICRFIPFVRGLASLPPGVSRMQKRYFLTYHTLGSAIFCFGLAYLGNLAGRHLDDLVPFIHRFSF
ncbi:MAG: DedA family protein, partial [Candidatus Eremiobacteraeota bacterium]|nr:DedA family protein [Candidatus Eremiobacteraeota bacterium]